MIRRVILAVFVMSFAVAAFAEEKATRLTIFATNPEFGWSEGSGSTWSGGVSVGLSHWLSKSWSMELAVGLSRHDASIAVVPMPDYVVFDRIRVNVYPVDLLAHYHFDTGESRWRPFLTGGGRYVGRPSGVPNASDYNELSAQLGAGVTFRLTPRLDLTLEGRRLLRGDAPPWDEENKGLVGIGWRF